MLKAIVFDFDGIIVDSEPLHFRAFLKALEPLGAGFSWAEYVEKYMGFDDRDAFREAFRAAGMSLTDEKLADMIALKASLFQEVAAEGVIAYPGVVQLIQSLSGTIPLALCSGALCSDIEPVLQMLSLSAVFDCMVTAEEVLHSKPDPASYCLAIEKLQQVFPRAAITAAEAVAIEDTSAGITSAKRAGLQVLAVTNSYPAAELQSADRIVTSLTDISLKDLRLLVP